MLPTRPQGGPKLFGDETHLPWKVGHPVPDTPICGKCGPQDWLSRGGALAWRSGKPMMPGFRGPGGYTWTEVSGQGSARSCVLTWYFWEAGCGQWLYILAVTIIS